MLTSALYLSCPAGTANPSTPPHCRRLLLSHTRMHVAATHPHRCVHVQGWCDSPLPPLCPCTVVGPTDQHAPLVWISIPGARSPSSMFSLVPGSRLVMSWAHSTPLLTNAARVLLPQTPACLKEPIHSSDIRRCPHGPPTHSHRRKNTTSRFQRPFHQLTGLVTLSPELLNSRLNALREHRGW